MTLSFSNLSRTCAFLALAVAAAGSVRGADAAPSTSAKCAIFTKSDAERVLRAPVVRVESPSPSDCAWGLARDPSIGVSVSRETPPLYPPHPGSAGVSHIRHVTGLGKDAYTYYANAGAGGVYSADVLTSKGITSVALSEKAGNAATALAIARIAMNR
jgi:hypothetical protein